MSRIELGRPAPWCRSRHAVCGPAQQAARVEKESESQALLSKAAQAVWLTLTVENGGVLVQCTPTFIGSSKNYKSRQLKSSLQFNNWRYTAKQSGAWYPRITTERMIFTTTSAHY
jgi:hypothetical protein